MMIVPIVEGHGEVDAVRVLLRRLNEKFSPGTTIEISKPIRVKRDQFLNKNAEFASRLQFAARKCAEYEQGWILLLLDADKDCPAKEGRAILERAQTIIPNHSISVILANREYEAWFIASALSLHGKRGFVFNEKQVTQPEAIQDAKGWLGSRMSGSYHPVDDQPKFSAHMDIDLALAYSRSFRKLCDEWKRKINS